MSIDIEGIYTGDMVTIADSDGNELTGTVCAFPTHDPQTTGLYIIAFNKDIFFAQIDNKDIATLNAGIHIVAHTTYRNLNSKERALAIELGISL